jgi:hypothetical protein
MIRGSGQIFKNVYFDNELVDYRLFSSAVLTYCFLNLNKRRFS